MEDFFGTGISTKTMLGLDDGGRGLVVGANDFGPEVEAACLLGRSSVILEGPPGALNSKAESLSWACGTGLGSDRVPVRGGAGLDSNSAATFRNASSSSEPTGLGRSSPKTSGDVGRGEGAFSRSPRLSLGYDPALRRAALERRN